MIRRVLIWWAQTRRRYWTWRLRYCCTRARDMASAAAIAEIRLQTAQADW